MQYAVVDTEERRTQHCKQRMIVEWIGEPAQHAFNIEDFLPVQKTGSSEGDEGDARCRQCRLHYGEISIGLDKNGNVGELDWSRALGGFVVYRGLIADLF